MSTRAQVRFATREAGISFNEHPEKINAQFYVHHDGYPEFLGVEIANSLIDSVKIDNLEIEELCAKHGDLDYIYYVWQSKYKTTWISIFKDNSFPGYCETCDQLIPSKLDKCIFVGLPTDLINKYKQNTNDDG